MVLVSWTLDLDSLTWIYATSVIYKWKIYCYEIVGTFKGQLHCTVLEISLLSTKFFHCCRQMFFVGESKTLSTKNNFVGKYKIFSVRHSSTKAPPTKFYRQNMSLLKLIYLLTELLSVKVYFSSSTYVFNDKISFVSKVKFAGKETFPNKMQIRRQHFYRRKIPFCQWKIPSVKNSFKKQKIKFTNRIIMLCILTQTSQTLIFFPTIMTFCIFPQCNKSSKSTIDNSKPLQILLTK